MTKILKVQFAGADLLTGLPEYRNGGLLVDTGLLTLKEIDMSRGLEAFSINAKVKGQRSMEVVPLFSTDDDVIVEWRAVTVGFLDELLPEVNRLLGLQGVDKLSLAQMLEAGTWKVRFASILYCISGSPACCYFLTCTLSYHHWLNICANADRFSDYLGRKRTSGGLEAKHERAANHDSF